MPTLVTEEEVPLGTKAIENTFRKHSHYAESRGLVCGPVDLQPCKL